MHHWNNDLSNQQDTTNSVKWNTNLMQHSAGFISAVTLHISDASAHHQDYLKLVQRPLVHVLSLQVSHHISLLGPNKEMWWLTCNGNTSGRCTSFKYPDDGRLRLKDVGRLCRNKTCTVLHQVGVSFDRENLSAFVDIPTDNTGVLISP